MQIIELNSPADFDEWRSKARAALANGVAARDAIWRVGSGSDLLAPLAESPVAAAATGSQVRPHVPAGFLAMAELVVCHRDEDRFGLLYRLLLRLQNERGLLEIASDPDVVRAAKLAKAVRRDLHKMTAFVRFRETPAGAGKARFVAWFEPDHYIEARAAGFFVDRYASMNFTILTPRMAIDWSNGVLRFGPGGRRGDVPEGDGFSHAWEVYYKSIFNPARLMVSAMTREMPRKYWANMPETRHIPELIAGAGLRTGRFLDAPATLPPLRHGKIAARRAASTDATIGSQTVEALSAEARGCRRCPLYANATQTVFGAGPPDARILFVGEQPGDREDLLGKPFVGPAGAVFDRALAQAGIARETTYVTNAVKHFKSEPRGKRRIHKAPNAGEVQACKWWLDLELALIKAPLVVALGATALRALTGTSDALARWRGEAHNFGAGRRLYVTVHPSYLLRLLDPESVQREQLAFETDMRAIAKLAA